MSFDFTEDDYLEADECEESLLRAQIATLDSQILLYRAVVTDVRNGAVQYSLDSGQTRQSVTKNTIGQLMRTLASLLNERAVLWGRLNGRSFQAVPMF